jgi:hypothetical protein
VAGNNHELPIVNLVRDGLVPLTAQIVHRSQATEREIRRFLPGLLEDDHG